MITANRVVITGGSSGLGLALAEALALRGARVALLARDRSRLDRAAAAVRSRVPNAIINAYAFDVGEDQGLVTGFEQIAGDLGGIDLLINSAGILREGYFDTFSNQDLHQVMEINLFGALNVVRAALPHLERERGRILNIASVAALTGVFGYVAYCASKHALLGASDALRAELGPRGIRVQVACPGEFDSPMVEEMEKTRTPENRAHVLALPKTPMEVIVRDILRGLDSGGFLIIPGRQARLFAFGLRHFPTISRFIGDRKVRPVFVGPKGNRSR